jgi:FkbM family methyltransferase
VLVVQSRGLKQLAAVRTESACGREDSKSLAGPYTQPEMALGTRIKELLADSGLEPAVLWAYTRLSPAEKDDRLALHVMKHALAEGSNCVDVGAHRGAMLQEIRRFAPHGRHFAIEPLPEFAGRLSRRYPDVTVISCALSDHSGETTFQYVRSNPAYSGIRQRDYPGMEEVAEITVPLRRLDDIVPPELPIALIKLDVEGGEEAVVRGATGVIRRSKPLILFEHERGAADRYGSGPGEMWELLVNQCGLQISLMSCWLGGEASLSAVAFEEQFEKGLSSYFLAHRPGCHGTCGAAHASPHSASGL